MPQKKQELIGGIGKADRIIVQIFKVISYVSAVCLVGIMIVAFFNVLGEKILHRGIPGSTEIVEYLHVPVVFLSAAFVTLDRGQTAIDLISQHFPKWLQNVTSTFCFLLGAAICTFVGYRGFVQMGKHLNTHAMSAVTGFGFPLWPFSFLFAIGFMMIAFSFIWSIVRIYAPKREVEGKENELEGGQPE
jgi:TRAP-type C4-dicarboxylate transport system permease small subunit